MTKEALALFINGVEYGDITEKQKKIALDNNLVIITGNYKGGILLHGAIDKEVGMNLIFNNKGVVELNQSEMLSETKNYVIGVDENTESIHTWVFKTDIPHATFNMEDDDDENYCLGIIIDLNDL